MKIITMLENENNIEKLRKTAIDVLKMAFNDVVSISEENSFLKLIIDNIDLTKDFPNCKNPKVSIVIPAKDNPLLTQIALNTIHKNTKKIKYEVIIADDNSNEETKNIYSMYKNIRVIENDIQHQGFVYNVTNAINYAKGEYIFLMNNDMIVCQNYLQELFSVIEKYEDIGIAGAKNLQYTGRILECGCNLTPDGGVQFLSHNQPPETNDDLEYIECDYCSGCSILFKKELWDKSGGFDKNLAPAYYEDSDFALNVKYNFGLKSVCVPKAKLFHFHKQTYQNRDLNNKDKINQAYFIKKWGKKLKEKK